VKLDADQQVEAFDPARISFAPSGVKRRRSSAGQSAADLGRRIDAGTLSPSASKVPCTLSMSGRSLGASDAFSTSGVAFALLSLIKALANSGVMA